MSTAIRGLLSGLGFGLAAASVDAWQLLTLALFTRIAPSYSAVAADALLELALLGVGGLVLSPLLRLPRGGLVHLLVLALLWWGLQLSLVLDMQIIVRLTQAATPIALGLTLAGRALARRRPWLAPGLGVALLVGGILAPGLYLALTTPAEEGRAAQPPARDGAPDVVLIVLDTVRASNMSAYGYARETTPVFDALAAEGALYLDATSPSTWSLASHAALFTGLFPSANGAHFEHRFLDPGPPTLAEVLTNAGYETKCFTANAFISDSLGLTRGFQYSDEAWRAGGAGGQFRFAGRLRDRLGFGALDKGGARVASNFEAWAAEPRADRPAFVFVNFLEAHFPYHQLPADYLNRFTHLPANDLRDLSMALFAAQFGGEPPDPAVASGPATDMYDGGIVYTDYLLGRILDALRARGRLDDTILVVMSDHGELLGEHGRYGHGVALYEPGIRVPLLVRYPPAIRAGESTKTPVSTVGVFATILDLAGLEAPAPLHVGSLVPALRGGPPAGPVLSERHAGAGIASAHARDPVANGSIRVRTYRAGDLKLVETSAGDLLLFDLAQDPDENVDLTASRPEDTARLRQELDTWAAALSLPAIDAPLDRGPAPEMDADARERLKALGYLE